MIPIPKEEEIQWAITWKEKRDKQKRKCKHEIEGSWGAETTHENARD